MKITIYKLLEMIKDGKAPKTIKSEGHYYNYSELEEDYYEGMGYDYEYLLANTSVKGLDNEIEIIEYAPKEEKKIPEKLDYCEENTFMIKCKENSYLKREEMRLLDSNFKELGNKINSIIDYLKSKGE